MNNEPVAWIWSEDGCNLGVCLDQDKQIGKQEFQDYSIPLYTHPVKELNDGGEPVKNATYWKRQYNLMSAQCDNLKSGLYHANEQIKYFESHPVKELSDEEIDELHKLHTTLPPKPWKGIPLASFDVYGFARAILRKAQEK